MLAANHQVDIILRPQAMGHSRKETVRIGRKIDSSKSRLEVQNSADEGRILVREAVVLLPGPCRSLDVVKRSTGLAPGRLNCHLGELGILDHHGMNDPEERLITREESSSARQGISL